MPIVAPSAPPSRAPTGSTPQVMNLMLAVSSAQQVLGGNCLPHADLGDVEDRTGRSPQELTDHDDSHYQPLRSVGKWKGEIRHRGQKLRPGDCRADTEQVRNTSAYESPEQ